MFKHFSQFSGLKPNKSKCEIASIGVLKGVKVALCGIRCVNLYKGTIKILRIYNSYNKQFGKMRISKSTLQKLRMC